MILVFDGDCGMCTRYAEWVRHRLPADVDVVAWQQVEDLSTLGLTRADVECAAWWLDGSRRAGGAEAIARSLVATDGPTAVMGRVLLAWPISRLARPVYRWIAHNRQRLPGSTDACRMP